MCGRLHVVYNLPLSSTYTVSPFTSDTVLTSPVWGGPPLLSMSQSRLTTLSPYVTVLPSSDLTIYFRRKIYDGKFLILFFMVGTVALYRTDSDLNRIPRF